MNSPAASKSRRRQPLPNLSSASALQNPSSTQQESSSLSGTSEAFQLPALPQQSRATYQPSPSSAKVAIPRLRRDSDNPPAAAAVEKHRVSHACEPCRQRKTKCSGERPVCKHCEEFKITCIYADGKRDRKKEIRQMAEKLEDYENLLRDLSFRASDDDQSRIRRALQKASSTSSSLDYVVLTRSRSHHVSPASPLTRPECQHAQAPRARWTSSTKTSIEALLLEQRASWARIQRLSGCSA